MRAIVAAVMAALIAVPTAAQTIGTGAPTSLQDGALVTLMTGRGASGQTFVSPGGMLTSFTFYNGGGTGNVDFVLAPISGLQPGATLYTSNPISLQVGANVFSGIQTPTEAGATYIAYVTNADVPDGANYLKFASNSQGGYAYGNAVVPVNSPGSGQFGYYKGYDYYFTATFESVAPAVPEPATWAMLILGFGAVGTTMRRIRRRTPVAAAFSAA